jgi:hypothetical protein
MCDLGLQAGSIKTKTKPYFFRLDIRSEEENEGEY